MFNPKQTEELDAFVQNIEVRDLPTLQKEMVKSYKSMMKAKYAGIPNIIAGKEIFTELIQHQATKAAIAEDLENNLTNLEMKIKVMQEVKRKIVRTDFSEFSEKFRIWFRKYSFFQIK